MMNDATVINRFIRCSLLALKHKEYLKIKKKILLLTSFAITHLLLRPTKVRYALSPSRHTRMPREGILKISGLFATG
jgi:hypothetical protein